MFLFKQGGDFYSHYDDYTGHYHQHHNDPSQICEKREDEWHEPLKKLQIQGLWHETKD